MADFFLEPDDGLEPRQPLEQREEDDDEIFALLEMVISEIRRNTDRLASGDISVDAWYDQMIDILSAYHLAGWYVGAGEDVEPDDDDIAALAEYLAEEFEYLEGFRDALLEEPDGSTLADKYRHRAEMYGWATGSSVWRGRTWYIQLPFYPKYRTTCASFCACGWVITAVDEDKGDYDATWVTTAAESCATCIERSKLKPLRIRAGEYDAKQITSGMYA